MQAELVVTDAAFLGETAHADFRYAQANDASRGATEVAPDVCRTRVRALRAVPARLLNPNLGLTHEATLLSLYDDPERASRNIRRTHTGRNRCRYLQTLPVTG